MGASYYVGYYVFGVLPTLAIPAFLLVPKLRNLWLAPLRRRRQDRLARKVTMAQARRDAREAILESQLDQLEPF